MGGPIYIAIDLKSFYASVECVDRNIDPLTYNLVVADNSRTDKTICLAVSPSLKSYGISGRPRLFEVVQRVKAINNERKKRLNGQSFIGKSANNMEVKNNKLLELDYIVAVPRMEVYLNKSAEIYNIYLKYIAQEDIFSYSVDEVFIDASKYLQLYQVDAHGLAMMLVKAVLKETGITATAGIGTNLYLAKVAMDIVAKKKEPDQDGVRIASLDELEYRKTLWNHTPLTDFWRVGYGIEKRLTSHHLYTMGDVARCSLGSKHSYYNEKLLYKLLGINAELLIDHAWGYEPCTMELIKRYTPQYSSLSSGQVLPEPYTYGKARLIVKEMADLLALELVQKKIVTNQLTLTISYDTANVCSEYTGAVVIDSYGRMKPKHAHGTINLEEFTSSGVVLRKSIVELYERIIDARLLVRKVNIVANNIVNEAVAMKPKVELFDLFTNYEEQERDRELRRQGLVKENCCQRAIIAIQMRYGKNALLKGMNLLEGAKTVERNNSIGGHRK